jgi:hypothetical protein
MLIRAKNEEGTKHRNTNGASHHAIVFQAQLETTSQRRWAFGPTSGPAGPGGGRPPITAICPGLSLVVAWRHAMSVPLVLHAKNREEHRLWFIIKRGSLPPQGGENKSQFNSQGEKSRLLLFSVVMIEIREVSEWGESWRRVRVLATSLSVLATLSRSARARSFSTYTSTSSLLFGVRDLLFNFGHLS